MRWTRKRRSWDIEYPTGPRLRNGKTAAGTPSCALATLAIVHFVAQCMGASTAPSPVHAPEDLTAKECLAAARKERKGQNWIQATAYYEQLESEYGATFKPAGEQLAYRLELLDCLLRTGKEIECINLIDTLRTTQKLPKPINCELLFRKGVCEYHLKSYSSARKTLEPLFSADHVDQTGNRQIIGSAFLIVAESLIAENRDRDAIAHLSREIDIEDQTKALGLALRTTAHLRLNLTAEAWDLLKTSGAQMRSWNLPASYDSLLLDTAGQFCQMQEPDKAIDCLMRTSDPEHCSKALQHRLQEIKVCIDEAAKRPQRSVGYSSLAHLHSILKNELNVLQNSKSRLVETAQLAASSLIAQSRYREASILLDEITRSRSLHLGSNYETARRMMLGCMLQMGRWEQATRVAEALESEQIDPKQRFETMLLRGIALSKSPSPARAIEVFQEICTQSKGTECAIRAEILRACTQLETGDYFGALASSLHFIESHPHHALSDTALCLLVAANLAAKKPLDALAAADRYLKDRTYSENRELVTFYRAKALLLQNNQHKAIDALRQCIKLYPSGEKTEEAQLLLADALLAVGDKASGIEALHALPPCAGRFFDEARLRLSKVLSVDANTQRAEESLNDFLSLRPESSRLSEACRELLKVSNANQTKTKALDSIWRLFEHRPQDCKIEAADRVIELIEDAYKTSSDPGDFERRLTTAVSKRPRGDNHAHIHCGCMIAMLWADWRASARVNQDISSEKLRQLEQAAAGNPSAAPPKILFDLANHFSAAGESDKSSMVWRELLRWNPCTKLKDRALLNLGLAELDRGETERALAYFARFENECPTSAMLPEMLLKRAKLYLAANEPKKRIQELMRIAGAKSAPVKIRGQALLEIGEWKIENHEYADAIIYLQRVFLTCLGHREVAARAYERAGFALEKLGQFKEASLTYAELLDHPGLCNTAAAAECRFQITAGSDSEM